MTCVSLRKFFLKYEERGGTQPNVMKPYCHSEPVRTLAWESQSIAYTEIATPVTRSLVRNDTNLTALGTQPAPYDII